MRDGMEEGFFAPLGIESAVWTVAQARRVHTATPYELEEDRPVRVPSVGFAEWPAGMLRLSAAGLARFVAAAANGGEGAAGRVLSENAAALMLRPFPVDGLPNWLVGQGLAWGLSSLGGRTVASHWGGDPGVFSAAYVDANTRTGAVVLMNRGADARSKAALTAIAERLLTDA